MNTGAPVLLNLESDSSEEDEELGPDSNSFLPPQQTDNALSSNNKQIYESPDYLDAKKAVSDDCWDVSSWQVLIQEIEQGRGGEATRLEIYTQATTQFPRAANLWKKLVEYHIETGDVQACEEVFRKCLPKCRNVDLWNIYLTFVQRRTIDLNPPHSEQYGNAKRNLDAAYERALDNVGMCADSSSIWRRYIEFVQSWPEGGALDAGRRLTALREIYQRAICNPMEDLEQYWKEYEELEMRAGEHLATQLLPEFRPRNQSARETYKARKKASSKIDLNRIAIPPVEEGSLTELQQLDLWNRWVRYEMSNPDGLSDDRHRSYMRMMFDRFLCCFRLHPEVWMAYARYELRTAGQTEARAVLKESLSVLPQVPTLWAEMAEFEEQHNSIDAAYEVLKSAFDRVPSAFTFALLQRVTRRRDGKVAARRLFSETLSMRKDGVLGCEVGMSTSWVSFFCDRCLWQAYTAHALVELEVNGEPDVALRVLEAARERHPTYCHSVPFLRLMIRVLVRLGDLQQLRWVVQTALGAAGAIEGSAIGSSGQRHKAAGGFSGQEQLILWEDLLAAELQLGLSDVARLSSLRDRIRALQRALEDHSGNRSEEPPFDIFDPAEDIFSRCAGIVSCLPSADAALRNRCRGTAYLEEVSRREDERMSNLMETAGGGGRRKRRDQDTHDAGMVGVPIFLRDLLSRLPAHTGPPPDVDAYLDQLKKTVLPPRPVTDEDRQAGGEDTLRQTEGTGDILMAGSKRGFGDIDDYDDDDDHDREDNRDDIFRQRCKMRMALP